VARDERRTVAWQALGVCSVVTGDSLGARSAFDRLIAMAPRSGTGWYNRGLLNFNEERYEAALADLRRAAELLPDNADIPDLIQRAQLLQRRKAEPGSP
jgi:tetratricopeptide (TPR) repeat protein